MADPIDPEFHATMNQLASGLDDIFNGHALPGIPRKRTVGFALLTFEFEKVENGRVNYISNAKRPEMVAALRELLARWEGRYVDLGAGVQ